MQYVTSNNLKTYFRLKNHMYKLLSINDCISDIDNHSDIDSYFCGECRSLLHIKHSSNAICPNCGLKYKDYSCNPNEQNSQEIPLNWLDVYHISDLIDSITINKSFHDDGNIKDINVTILYHSYKISSDLQKETSWQHYDRILFNFETKQIYYTDKLTLSKKVNFKHFKLHETNVSKISKFSVAIPFAIREIYDSYGIVCDHDTWKNLTPKNMRSSTIAFMCLKFPIMMNYTFDLWTSYKHRQNACCVVDMHVSMIYWACNYDRVLKKALTSTTEQEYIERTDNIMHEITSDYSVIESVRNNPLYVVYARYMHQLGFVSFNSIEQIVECVSMEGAHKKNISIWIFDMLCRRTHVRNKMYRRLLKIYGEDTLLNILFNSRHKSKYSEFFSGYAQRLSINTFYYCLENQFNDTDFLNNIDDIFDDIVY